MLATGSAALGTEKAAISWDRSPFVHGKEKRRSPAVKFRAWPIGQIVPLQNGEPTPTLMQRPSGSGPSPTRTMLRLWPSSVAFMVPLRDLGIQ
jgi:hypothetical protein